MESTGRQISGVPVVAAVDFNIIPDRDEKTVYYGTTTSLGTGTPGVEAHYIQSRTGPIEGTRFNIFTGIEKWYNRVMEW